MQFVKLVLVIVSLLGCHLQARAKTPVEIRVNKTLSISEKNVAAVEVLNANIARVERHPLSQRLVIRGVGVGKTRLVRTLLPSGEKIATEIVVVENRNKLKKAKQKSKEAGCVRNRVRISDQRRCGFVLSGWD